MTPLVRSRITRVAVISDVHANGCAYREALTAARACGFDQLIILGDLLTYGCEPLDVLALTHQAVIQDGAQLIVGNHDQLYFDILCGNRSYYDGLPAWLRETVDWTSTQLAGLDLRADFAWQRELILGQVLFAHANPFPFGDWTYLNTHADFLRAFDCLRLRDLTVGVFGHTHRPKIAESADESPGDIQELRLETNATDVFAISLSEQRTLIDVGSVGQPRDERKACTMAILSIAEDNICVEFKSLSYDRAVYVRKMQQAAISETTKQRLLRYFQ
jgi:predicted phosphodiesterase